MVNHRSDFNTRQLLQCLQFDDRGIKTNRVRPAIGHKAAALVENRDTDFALERNVPFQQILLKGLLTNPFQKSATGLPMHFHRGTDDSMGPQILFVFVRHGQPVSLHEVVLLGCSNLRNLQMKSAD